MDKPDILYRKKKDVTISLTAMDHLLVEVRHVDPRHHMVLTVEFTQPRLKIADVRSKMVDYPHKGCILAANALRAMIGEKMQRGIMKQVHKRVGNQGCTHLTNLFQEACYSVIQGQGLYRRRDLEQRVPGLTMAQTGKIMMELRPELIDSCVSYIPGDELIESFEQAALPDNPNIAEFIKKNRT